MALRHLNFLLRRLCFISKKQTTSGFTLIELLVGMSMASLIVSGLLYLVVELLQTNQRESAQTQTQQEMQMALDYISSELREAVYVYGGDCLQGVGSLTNGVPSASYCPGIVNHIPSISNSAPILAFWKLAPLPEPLRNQCSNSSANTPAPALNVPCLAGRTYTLIVYLLIKNQSTDITNWAGKSRITRYELTQYSSDGTVVNQGYVNPDQTGINFNSWPYKESGGTLTNQQIVAQTSGGGGGLPQSNGGNTRVLVDFVDDTVRPEVGDRSVSDSQNRCFNSDTYRVTPTNNTLSSSSYPNGTFTDVRSFYACVNVGAGNSVNQDIFVFLRGNPSGKAGINNDKFLPVLQTQVLRRGIVNKEPTPLRDN